MRPSPIVGELLSPVLLFVSERHVIRVWKIHMSSADITHSKSPRLIVLPTPPLAYQDFQRKSIPSVFSEPTL